MEKKFKKGDIIRAKRAILKRLLHFPISRSEIMTVIDVNEIQYSGNNFISIGVITADLSGEIHHYSQDNLEKI